VLTKAGIIRDREFYSVQRVVFNQYFGNSTREEQLLWNANKKSYAISITIIADDRNELKLPLPRDMHSEKF